MPGITNENGLIEVLKELKEKISTLQRSANILRVASSELLRQTRSINTILTAIESALDGNEVVVMLEDDNNHR